MTSPPSHFLPGFFINWGKMSNRFDSFSAVLVNKGVENAKIFLLKN